MAALDRECCHDPFAQATLLSLCAILLLVKAMMSQISHEVYNFLRPGELFLCDIVNQQKESVTALASNSCLRRSNC